MAQKRGQQHAEDKIRLRMSLADAADRLKARLEEGEALQADVGQAQTESALNDVQDRYYSWDEPPFHC